MLAESALGGHLDRRVSRLVVERSETPKEGGHGSVVAAAGDVCYDAFRSVAPLPVIANVYRVALNWTNADFPSRVATNVIHLRKAGSNPAALWTSLDAHATAAMWETQDTHTQVNSVAITPLDGSGTTLTVNTGRPAKWSGAQATHDFSPQTCTVLKLVTAKRGRSYRGRVYLPFTCENSQVAGIVDNGQGAAMTAAWVAWMAAMAADGFALVVASYLLSTAENVVALACEADVATQRRRNKRTAVTI